ncbi:MAG: precorrin-8X methylmutase [Firmicutes bacterium]|nr:precorrin-8X methylmutase [Bacillota bacterium]
MSFVARPEEIEARSRAAVDRLLAPLAHAFSGDALAILRRVVHATGDPGFAELLAVHPHAVAAGLVALEDGARIVCDVKMVAAGITGYGGEVLVAVERPGVAEEAGRLGITRALAGIRACRPLLRGSVVAIGNAPTALFGLLELLDGGVRPALVVATPVGFVGAAEAKEALMARDVPWVVVRGTKGGSAVAAAVVNALLALREEKLR